MSARGEKLKRRAKRLEQGLSKVDIREQEEFEAAVRRRRFELAADVEIVSRAPRQTTLAWLALACIALAALVLLWGAGL